MDEQLIHERMDEFELRLAELLALVEELVEYARPPQKINVMDLP